jgi:hypothetical protein
MLIVWQKFRSKLCASKAAELAGLPQAIGCARVTTPAQHLWLQFFCSVCVE